MCTASRRLALSALLAAAAFAVVSPAAGAAAGGRAHATSARARDLAATRTFIAANYTLVRIARDNLAAAQTAINTLGERVSGECPLAAGSEAPQNLDSGQLSEEVVGALEVAAYEVDRASMLAFGHAIRGLRWSNRKLTRMVRAYAVKLENFPMLGLPNICTDVKAWAATGYASLPATTVAFDKGVSAYGIENEEIPLGLLRPYENAAEVSLLRRTRQLEAPITKFETEAVSDYSKILDSLKLPQ
ncbi:MAG TPA: hypothetical protein VNV37_09925 [Solirubrobacteraceae bacterium]|jgi:hypothetical protein|nr:hypothetical protein [Solirubrobacteraceae bacterium]